MGVPHGLLRLTGPSLEGERVLTPESMTSECPLVIYLTAVGLRGKTLIVALNKSSGRKPFKLVQKIELDVPILLRSTAIYAILGSFSYLVSQSR